MPVKLRKSKLKNGYSFYFDISYKGKRWTEWTKIRVRNSSDPEVKEENKQNILLAKKMRSERDRELIVLGKGLPAEVNAREKDFFDVYDELCIPRIRSKDICKNIRKKIRLFVGEGRPLPIAAINKQWLSAYLGFLKREGMHNNTVHQYFGFMGTILREAMCAGYIVQNPFNLFNKHERPKQKRRSADNLSIDELDAFINCETTNVDEQLKQMFLFSCFTGLRWSDCQRVKWNQMTRIDIEGRKTQVIRMAQKKTGDDVCIPLSTAALQIIQLRKRVMMDEPDSPYIFPKWSDEREGGKIKPLNGKANQHLKRWATAAKFERYFSFHIARHTFATWLIESGSDLYTVSKLLGHADMSATTIYAKMSNKVKVAAVDRFPTVDVTGKCRYKPLVRVA
jgi:site-specific recombinase XerD